MEVTFACNEITGKNTHTRTHSYLMSHKLASAGPFLHAIYPKVPIWTGQTCKTLSDFWWGVHSFLEESSPEKSLVNNF